ncbi:MAG: DUF4430 domain-containing protein [Eubacteriales bacterium]|nr:DUF4430 domain-containing protein [Eubacteriales bacterium]
MRNHKWKIIWSIVIIALLVFTYWWGGNSPSLHGWTVKRPPPKTEQTMTMTESTTIKAPKSIEKETTQPKAKEETPVPVDNTTSQNTCTLSINCGTILNNMELLADEKRSIIPPNGVILSETTVDIKQGDTVFDVLLRETTNRKIHMEFTPNPLLNSSYIEGIANIYEFECGELSGWMYRVNGVFPGYGSSSYGVKNGDKIEWIFTCDVGYDVGGGGITNNR